MGNTAPLNTMEQVTLDSNGDGQVSAGPTGFGETWTNVQASVHCATNTTEATCKVYAGAAASPQFFADGTTWGSTGDSSTNLPPVITGGQQVFAVWSGGDASTTAYLTLTGTRNVA